MTNPRIDQELPRDFNIPKTSPNSPVIIPGSETYTGEPFVASKEIDISKRTRLAVFLGGASVALAAVFGGLAYVKGFSDGVDKLIPDTTNASPLTPDYQSSDKIGSVSGDLDSDGNLSKTEIQALSPIGDAEAIKSIDVKFLLDAYSTDFDTWRQDAFDIMKKYTTSEQSEVIALPLEEDKSLYSDQDVINAVSIDIADASMQTDNPVEGQRMLPLVMDKDCPGFDGYYGKIPENNIIVDVSRHTGKQIPQPMDTFMGHNLDDTVQARVIEWENVPGEHESADDNYHRYALYTLNEHNGQSIWRLVDKWDTSRQDVQTAIEALSK